ncbi:10822_t:CDS:2, partial [Paraglomus brasilianum]
QVYKEIDGLHFSESAFRINNGFTYPNGTGLMQLVSPGDNNLYIRLLNLDGTLTPLNVSLDCNSYCLKHAYPLNDGYVFVIVTQSEKKSVYGMLIDWSGQVLQSNITLTGIADYDYRYLTSNAKANVDPDTDFIVVTGDRDTVSWKIFNAPNSTGITELHNGILGNDDKILQGYEIFPTTEGGYGIALLKSVSAFTQDPRISQTFSSSPQWLLYVTFWQPDSSEFDTPRIVWQNPNPLAISSIIGCEVDLDGSGYFCLVLAPAGNAWEYVRVAFLSSGSVTDINVVVVNDANKTTMHGIRQLPYGGFLSIEQITEATIKRYDSTNDQSQRTVQQIIGDLDDLIKNKYYNAFSHEYPTSYLDETYGFVRTANSWEVYKFKLIGLFAGILVLLIIYFFARWKYPEGQSFHIVKIALILADLSLDVAFVLLSAKNVPKIHIPRLLTVSYDTIPFLSLVMSSIILISNIIGHVYGGCIRWKEKERGHSIPKEEILAITADVQEDE